MKKKIILLCSFVFCCVLALVSYLIVAEKVKNDPYMSCFCFFGIFFVGLWLATAIFFFFFVNKNGSGAWDAALVSSPFFAVLISLTQEATLETVNIIGFVSMLLSTLILLLRINKKL